MFIATALTLRGENNILSSSPQEAAHLLQNCKRAFAGGTGTMESRGNTRHQDLARRPALMISRIVSRSLFDVPVNKVGPVFSAQTVSACSIIQESRLLEPFSDPARGLSTQGPSVISAVAPEGEPERSGSIAAPQRTTKTQATK
jgi:hypothetical protein